MVALAVKRREEEDKRAQDGAADEQLHVGLILEAGEHVFADVHGADEVERHQSTGNA